MATIYFFMMKMIIFIYILLGWCYSNYGPLERENTEHSHVFACSFTPLLPKPGKKKKKPVVAFRSWSSVSFSCSFSCDVSMIIDVYKINGICFKVFNDRAIWDSM